MKFDTTLINLLKNVHTYAATPFLETDLYELDLQGFRQNIEFLIDHGMQVIAVGGGTGEIEALSADELVALTQTALDVAGERALIIPCLPGNLRTACDLLKSYEGLNARMAMAVPPQIRWKNPAALQGVLEYYQQLSLHSNLPLMPYNTQSWPVEYFEKLAQVDSIIGIKDPCHNPHEFFKAIQKLGDRFVWIGNKRHDPGIVHLRYQMGMQGFTSGQSNFWPEPELMIHQAALQADWSRVIELQEMVAPLERLRLENDDAAMVKAAMDLVGLKGGAVRPPRVNISPEGKTAIEHALQGLLADAFAS